MVALAGLTVAVRGLQAGTQFVAQNFSAINQIITTVSQTINRIFGGALDFISEKWQGIKGYLEDAFGDGLWGGISTIAKDAFNAIFEFIFGFAPPPIFTKDYWVGEDGVFTQLGGYVFDFAAMFGFDLPTIFSKDYWTGEEGVFTTIANFIFPWTSLFEFEMPEVFTDGYWTGEDKGLFSKIAGFVFPWSNLFSFSMPAIFTKDYWTGDEGGVFSSISKFVFPWSGLFAVTLPQQLTFSYWFGENGIFSRIKNFDFNWGSLFKLLLPDWLTVDYWFGERGLFTRLKNWNPIGNAIVTGLKTAYDTILKPMFEGVGDMMRLVTRLGVGSATKVKPGAASATSTGGGNTFNITVNAGGITDRTDKRQLAREIGNLIQQEMSRSIGGTTMSGRF